MGGLSLAKMLEKSNKGLMGDDCWPWQGVRDKNDYPIHGRAKRVIRILYRMYIGELNSDEVVRHTCDNPPCVNWTHFIKGSQADNVQDMMLRDRESRGSNHPIAKIDEDDVFDIREAWASGRWKQKALAEIYGISQAQVSNIVRRVGWKKN